MDEMKITVRSAEKKPDYQKTAAELLAAAREFYQDPENERAFQEWKAERRGKHEQKAAV